MTSGDRRIAAVATGQLSVLTGVGARRRPVGPPASAPSPERHPRPDWPQRFRYASSPDGYLGVTPSFMTSASRFCHGPTAAALHRFDGFRLRPRITSWCQLIGTSRANVGSSHGHRRPDRSPRDRSPAGDQCRAHARGTRAILDGADSRRPTAPFAGRLGGLSHESPRCAEGPIRTAGAAPGAPARPSARRGLAGREYLRPIHDAGLPRPDTIRTFQTGDQLSKLTVDFNDGCRRAVATASIAHVAS
jgi:hypothetical protein